MGSEFDNREPASRVPLIGAAVASGHMQAGAVGADRHV
jgi:hypothetical protein